MAEVAVATPVYPRVKVRGSKWVHLTPLVDMSDASTFCGRTHEGEYFPARLFPNGPVAAKPTCPTCKDRAFPKPPRPFGLSCSTYGCDTEICCYCGRSNVALTEIEPETDPHSICATCFPLWWTEGGDVDALIGFLFGESGQDANRKG